MAQYVGYKKMKITEEHLAAVRKLEDARGYFDNRLHDTVKVKSWTGWTSIAYKYRSQSLIPFEYIKYICVIDIGDTFDCGRELIYKDYVEDAIKYVPTNVGEEIEIALEYAKVLDELLEDYLEGRLEL